MESALNYSEGQEEKYMCFIYIPNKSKLFNEPVIIPIKEDISLLFYVTLRVSKLE